MHQYSPFSEQIKKKSWEGGTRPRRDPASFLDRLTSAVSALKAINGVTLDHTAVMTRRDDVIFAYSLRDLVLWERLTIS